MWNLSVKQRTDDLFSDSLASDRDVVGLNWIAYSPSSALVTASGITSLGYRFSNNGGSSWGNSGVLNAVQINASEITASVPEPETLFLFIPAAFGLLAVQRRKVN